MCDDANEACPIFPGRSERLHCPFPNPSKAAGGHEERLHWSFPDPSKAAGGYEERLRAFREVRDEIRARIEGELAKQAV